MTRVFLSTNTAAVEDMLLLHILLQMMEDDRANPGRIRRPKNPERRSEAIFFDESSGQSRKRKGQRGEVEIGVAWRQEGGGVRG
mmetsp:Transcript_29452/g.71780  ORF Transcript_29452/g.71780 Transcript_29452/m.71780 type:complete len:84 (+) Transcript_29452:1249-1500(+)